MFARCTEGKTDSLATSATTPYDQHLRPWITGPNMPLVHRLVWEGRYIELQQSLEGIRADMRASELYRSVVVSMERDPWFPLGNLKWKRLSEVFPRTRRELLVSAGPFELTPLHLSAMKGDTRCAEMLLAEGVPMNARDVRRWTALHHAGANHDISMMALLLMRGADRTLHNHRVGNMYDLYQMTKEPSPANCVTVHYWDPKKRQAVRQTADKVLGEGLRFTSEVYTSPRQLADDWALNEGLSMQCAPAILKWTTSKYSDFLKQPPRLEITDEPIDDLGQPVKGVGLCVIAAQNIPRGAIVAEYCGEQTDKGYRLSNYRISRIDGDGPKRLRSYGALIADGFPNCTLQPIVDSGGRYRVVALALRPIKRGTLPLIDYGSDHLVKKDGHRELAPDELHRFISNPKVQGLLRDPDMHVNWTHFEEPFWFEAGITYFLQSPSAYLRAVLQWNVQPAELLKWRQKIMVDDELHTDRLAPMLTVYVQLTLKFNIFVAILGADLIRLVDRGEIEEAIGKLQSFLTQRKLLP